MADGCNLYLTESDLIQAQNSLKVGYSKNTENDAQTMLDLYIKNNVEEFKKTIFDSSKPQYKIIDDLFRKAFKNDLSDTDLNKLPKALLTILNVDPNVHGIFHSIPKPRGEYSSPLQHAGELILGAAIIQKEEISTSLGNLIIDKNDIKLSFGQKYFGEHYVSNKTLEADLQLYLKQSNIGVDIKYSKTSTHYGIKNDSFNNSLEKIRNCFADGSLNGYYFISNVEFSEPFINKINEYNILIFQDRFARDLDMQNDFKYLTNIEKKGSIISASIEELNSILDVDHLNLIAKKYDIPQIGYCEKIKFEG